MADDFKNLILEAKRTCSSCLAGYFKTVDRYRRARCTLLLTSNAFLFNPTPPKK